MKLLFVLALVLVSAMSSWALPHTTAGGVAAQSTSAGRVTMTAAHWSADMLVSITIDGRVYSNNPSAVGAIPLVNPVFGQLRDTLVVRWSTEDSIDLYVRSYPYTSDLLLEISFANRSNTSHSCAAEALLNYFVEGVTAPYLGTDRDYGNTARQIPALGGNQTPPSVMFVAQNNVGVDPYTIGYASASRFSGLGLSLLGPQHLYFSVWSALATVPFGPPSVLPTGCDGGTLLVWDQVEIPAKTTTAIGRWTITNNVFVCSSSDVVLVTMPTAIEPAGARSFNLEAVAYSVNQRGLTQPRIELSVSDPLEILTFHNGRGNLDTASLGADMTKGSARSAEWKILSAGATTGENIRLTTTGDNLTPFYRDGCGFHVDPPTTSSVADFDRPLVAAEIASGKSGSNPCTAQRYAVTIVDPKSGVDRAAISGFNFSMDTMPYIWGSDSAVFIISVIDSMIDGSATVTFADRKGNTVSRIYSYCSVEDTSAPEIRITNFVDSAYVMILERRPWDRGIQYFSITSAVNARLDSSILYQSLDSIFFVVRKIDRANDASLCLVGRDRASNTSGVLCWTSTASAMRPEAAPSEITFSPNPATNKITLVPQGRTVTHVSLLDLLGRTELSKTPSASGPIDLDLTSLPAGVYIVRIVTDTDVISRRIEVIR